MTDPERSAPPVGLAALRLLVAKDLARRLRSPLETILSLAMPLALTAVIGLAFGGGGESGVALPPIGVAVLDHDDSFVSHLLSGALDGIDGENAPVAFDLRHVASEDQAWRAMKDGEVSAMIELPAGLADSLFEGGSVDLGLVRNPGERILPEIVEQVVGVGAVLLSEAVTHLSEPLERTRLMVDSLESWPDELTVAALSRVWNRDLQRFERWALPPAVTLESSSAEDETEEDAALDAGPSIDIFGYILPGIAFLSLLFLAGAAHRDMFTERSLGTFQRVAASPAGTAALLASKFASATAIAAIGLVLLLISGSVVFGSRWGDPLGLALMIIAGSFAASGTVGVLYGGSKTERQAETLSPIVILTISFVGGSMIPLDNLPTVAQSIAPFTPNYWLIEGLHALTVESASAAEILPQAGVLAGFGAAGVLVGLGLVRRRAGSGA